MYTPVRVWSSVTPVIRSVIGSRSELIQTVKTYGNPQPVSQTNHPRSIICSTPQHQHNNYYQLYAASTTATPAIQNLNLSLKALSLSPITTAATPSIPAADFPHTENEHAHKVLLSLPMYKCSTVTQNQIENVMPPMDTTNCPPPLPDINWDTIHPQWVAGSFMNLSRQCASKPMDLSSTDYRGLCTTLSNNLQVLTDEQLRGVLAALTLWPRITAANSSNFTELWRGLDIETIKRSNYWSLQDSFLVADFWFSLRLSRIGSYTKTMLSRFSKSIVDMEPHQLVQYLFHVNLVRDHPANVNFHLLENKIASVIDQLSLEELGVIAMGLFKTQSFMKSDLLVDAYFEKLLQSDLSSLSSILLGSIFKILRKSASAKRVHLIYELLNKTLPLLPQVSIQAQLQIALLGNDTLVFHPQVIDYIAVNFVDNAKSLRLKDIERILFVLMLYNYAPKSRPDFYDIFADELRNSDRKTEINTHPKCFLSSVNYMASMGILHQDLISTALQPSLVEALQRMSDSYYDISREIIELECILELEELKDYKGNRLDPKMKKDLLKIYCDKIRLPREFLNAAGNKNKHALTHNEALTLDIEGKIMALLGGEDMVATSHIAPHFPTADIIFCTTGVGKPVPVPEEFLSYPTCSIRRPVGGAGLQWVAVMVGGRNSYIRGTDRLRGQAQTRCRHLTKLGYNVVLVRFTDYRRFNLRRKLTYLEDLLVESGALDVDRERVNTAFLRLKEEHVKAHQTA